MGQQRASEGREPKGGKAKQASEAPGRCKKHDLGKIEVKETKIRVVDRIRDAKKAPAMGEKNYPK